MNLSIAMDDLRCEKEKLDRAIALLEQLQGVVTVAAPEKKRRGRKFMSAKERLEVSARIKKYWQARRASGTDNNALIGADPIVVGRLGSGY